MATMKELLRLNSIGQLNDNQAQWFRSTKPTEELFDVLNDPFELNNLANDINHKRKLIELRNELERWAKEIEDKGLIPEEELIKQFWPQKIQPKTSSPILTHNGGKTTITCDTKGAAIGYKFKDDDLPWIGWRPYKDPLFLGNCDEVKIIAHRIGYLPSDTLKYICQ